MSGSLLAVLVEALEAAIYSICRGLVDANHTTVNRLHELSQRERHLKGNHTALRAPPPPRMGGKRSLNQHQVCPKVPGWVEVHGDPYSVSAQAHLECGIYSRMHSMHSCNMFTHTHTHTHTHTTNSLHVETLLSSHAYCNPNKAAQHSLSS